MAAAAVGAAGELELRSATDAAIHPDVAREQAQAGLTSALAAVEAEVEPSTPGPCFAAGFSERFATDMVERAGQVLAGQPTTPDGQQPPRAL